MPRGESRIYNGGRCGCIELTVRTHRHFQLTVSVKVTLHTHIFVHDEQTTVPLLIGTVQTYFHITLHLWRGFLIHNGTLKSVV